MTPSQPDIQTIDDLNTFFSLLTSWHKGKVDTLNHMRDVPEGTSVTLNDETVPSITLTGDVLSGFKLGIDLSLMELGTLPFYPHVEDEASEA